MGASAFRSQGGFAIGSVVILKGNGAPGNDSGPQDAAGIGSTYFDATNGKQYLKKTSGTGTNKWVRMQDGDDLASAQLGQSWREPVLVRDNTARADLAAAMAAANVDNKMDGVTISDGSRILLDNVTGANKNVYLVSGSTGAWVFTEEGNAASLGDALIVQSGSYAGVQFGYNGSSWVAQNTGADTEAGFMRTFMGKSASGNETPTYSSTHVVTNATSLETAIGTLDAEIGAGVSGQEARTKAPIADQAVNANIKALDDAIGPTPTSTNTISASADINTNLSALDGQLALAHKQTTVNAITTITTVDEVLVDACVSVGWEVHALNVGTPANVYKATIQAVHDGTTSTDATTQDYSSAAELAIGGEISGLSFSVDINGTGTAQTMRLRCASTTTVNVKAIRTTLAA